VKELKVDLVVVGGGLGGVAAALAASRAGLKVAMTEEFDWIGGQMTSQGVPPDEASWVEQFGITASYRALRDGIRDYYRRHYPLMPASHAWREFNPGAGSVSRLCPEPRVSLAVMEAMLAPYRSSGRLTVLQPFKAVAVDVDGDRVRAVTVAHRDTGRRITIAGSYVIDATETGELLPLSGTEFVTGFEARSETGEPSAPDRAEPLNMQAVSYCFAMDHVDGDHTIDRPANYDRWRASRPAFWGADQISWQSPHARTLETVTSDFTPNPDDDPLSVISDQRLSPGDDNLWIYRRIAARRNFVPGTYESDITLVNWPMLDYVDGPIFGVPEAEARQHLLNAHELARSCLYWMQTEAPRADGGVGYPGLRLRSDVTGTIDGLAQAPYIRESRRIRAEYTIVEQDLSYAVRGKRGAVHYADSVGVGMYRIDLHPSTGGDNFIDVASCPFEIPLGALVPERMQNLIPACKNIGTTHITNGCYRLHPIEWNIGEAAGALAAFCVARSTTPHAVRADAALLSDFQTLLTSRGVELRWPEIVGY
jgi:hypothetical protein